MRIAHVGLAAYYTDGMTYQDNQLAEQNARDGHQVLYISNAAKYVNGQMKLIFYIKKRSFFLGMNIIIWHIQK